jgi:hypothetical protein
MLAQFGLKPSMSRRGNCLDNASIESFFSHLKTEALQYHHIQDPEQAQIIIQRYICFYNEERPACCMIPGVFFVSTFLGLDHISGRGLFSYLRDIGEREGFVYPLAMV